MISYAQNHEDVVHRVTEKTPGWTPRFIDHQVGERVYKELMRFVTDIRDDPRHPAVESEVEIVPGTDHRIRRRPHLDMETRQRHDRNDDAEHEQRDGTGTRHHDSRVTRNIG